MTIAAFDFVIINAVIHEVRVTILKYYSYLIYGSQHQAHTIPTPLNITLRIVFGTGVFALIVWTAAHFPAAAGLMLTFPALNGIAFIFSRRDTVDPITKTMLWMPLINGTLCVSYMTAFSILAAPQYATALAWGLALSFALLWPALSTRPWVGHGVTSRLQWPYAVAVVLFGAAATLVWWYFTGPTGAGASGSTAKPELSWLKVALFAMALWILIVLPTRFGWKDGATGILSGLPLISLAGLLSIAQDSAIDLESRRVLFVQMMLGAWLAPAMAVAFIYGVSRVLVSPRAHALRVLVVSAGWVLCFISIIITGAALQWLAAT